MKRKLVSDDRSAARLPIHPRTVLALLTLLAIAGCSESETRKGAVAPITQEAMASLDEPEDRPITIDVEMEVTRASNGAAPEIEGSTNLPDGTALMVRIYRPYLPDAQERLARGLPACSPDCRPWEAEAVVYRGRFLAETMGPNNEQPEGGNGLADGVYVVHVFASNLLDESVAYRGPLVTQLGPPDLGIQEANLFVTMTIGDPKSATVMEAQNRAQAQVEMLSADIHRKALMTRQAPADTARHVDAVNQGLRQPRAGGTWRFTESRDAYLEAVEAAYFAESCGVIPKSHGAVIARAKGIEFFEEARRHGVLATAQDTPAAIQRAASRAAEQNGCRYWSEHPEAAISIERQGQLYARF